MKLSRTSIFALIALAVLILVGAYFLFQNKQSAALPETVPFVPSATTSVAVPAASAGKTGTIVVSQGGDVKATFDMQNLKVGGSISPITITLPAGSDGKVLVLILHPMGPTSARDGILLATQVHPTAPTYQISGLKLTKMTDPSTGSTVNIIPGTYAIQTVLWDRSPFGPAGTYANLKGNNGSGTQGASFTISPAS